MKRILLSVGAALFLISCDRHSNTKFPQNLPIAEMKDRVEAEEIPFEIEEAISDNEVEDGKIETLEEIEPEQAKKTQPGYGDPYKYIDDKPIAVGNPRPVPPDMVDVKDSGIDGVYLFPEVDPQFPDGMGALKKFIRENLIYPDREVSYHGTIYVSFVVGQDGSIEDEQIVRGVSQERNAEALRVIRLMPNWIPAKHNGKIVAAKVRLPINFDLY